MSSILSGFSFYFLGMESSKGVVLDDLLPYFVNYCKDDWRKGSGDGFFSFQSESGDVAGLYLISDGLSSISVRYNFRASGDRRGAEMYSCGDVHQMDVIVDVGEDQFVPAGSFISAAHAWRIVCDFYSDPYRPSDCVKWIDSSGIRWPDDF